MELDSIVDRAFRAIKASRAGTMTKDQVKLLTIRAAISDWVGRNGSSQESLKKFLAQFAPGAERFLDGG